jgi:hypothetical protein
MFARFYGMDADEYEAKVNQHLDELLEQTLPFLRVRGEHKLRSILRDNLIKNQFQTATSAGFLSPPLRKRTEQALFGLPENTVPVKRPVYGYLHVDPEGRFAMPPLGNDYADN